MKLKEFKKAMQKSIFTSAEAHIVAFKDSPRLTNLQLHQWKNQGELIQLKRGLFMFAGSRPELPTIAQSLYGPCYLSLEYALNLYGIMPEAVFTYTLVTTKTTRQFATPLGTFSYQKIKKEAFTGYDSKTLMAEKEKALVDYFYLNSGRLQADTAFWEESRLEIPTDFNFKKAQRFAKLFNSKKLTFLLTSFEQYAKSHTTHRPT